MKPKSPFTQPFDQLPAELPIYPLENALLPGGQLPLELAEPHELALFQAVLKSDQLVGMVQPKSKSTEGEIYLTGCAGRVRQYRERKDGKINVMLTGVCRYRVSQELPLENGYRKVIADWSEFANDYETEEIHPARIDLFMTTLRSYFERHQMGIDWEALNKLHIEEVVNNLVLVMNFSVDHKQQLLEAPSVQDRMALFANLLEEKSTPIWTGESQRQMVN